LLNKLLLLLGGIGLPWKPLQAVKEIAAPHDRRADTTQQGLIAEKKN
jgi:hypothetical protein